MPRSAAALDNDGQASENGARANGFDGRSRGDYAYARIARDILAGVYAPNQHLTEAELSQSLGVSRTTLRVVLGRLHQEGLVEQELNRGARVRAFSRDEAIELLRIREVLEGLATSLAAQRATPQELEGLAQVVDEMETAMTSTDLLGYVALTSRFHAIVNTSARSAHLDRLLETIDHATGRYRFLWLLVPGRKEESLAEHSAILECLRNHDIKGSESIGRRHVANMRKRLQQADSFTQRLLEGNGGGVLLPSIL